MYVAIKDRLLKAVALLLLVTVAIHAQAAPLRALSFATPVQDSLILLSGRVTDEKGAPFPGVTVFVPALRTGTTTDEQGRFSIKAPPGAMLQFKAVGYQANEVPVNGR